MQINIVVSHPGLSKRGPEKELLAEFELKIYIETFKPHLSPNLKWCALKWAIVLPVLVFLNMVVPPAYSILVLPTLFAAATLLYRLLNSK